MNDSPLVSIIIPTYNRGKYIIRAINSCLNQTYKNIEVLVIDDRSSDNTEEVVKSIQDDRVKYFRNKKNSGPCVSRNNGIKYSQGEYINFLDDDDELLPKKIELQLEKFESSDIENVGVVVCHIKSNRLIDKNKNNVKNDLKGNIYKEALAGTPVKGTGTMLIKKQYLEKIGGWDVSLPSAQDPDLVIRLSKIVNFDYVDKVLFLFNDSENQISYNFKKKIMGACKYFWKHQKAFFEFGFVFWLCNLIRFTYLIFIYIAGLIFGKKAYYTLLIKK